MIVLPFPPPPLAVMYALELLQDLRRRERGGAARAGAEADLERPWEPARCSGELGAAVWSWCDDVVAWINHEYAWRPAQMIPGFTVPVVPLAPRSSAVDIANSTTGIMRLNGAFSPTSCTNDCR